MNCYSEPKAKNLAFVVIPTKVGIHQSKTGVKKKTVTSKIKKSKGFFAYGSEW